MNKTKPDPNILRFKNSESDKRNGQEIIIMLVEILVKSHKIIICYAAVLGLEKSYFFFFF